MKRDTYHGSKTVEALPIAAYTATTNGTIIDTQSAEGVLIQVQLGTLTTVDASNYLTITMEHGDDAALADAATVTSTMGLFGSAVVVDGSATAGQIVHLGYTGVKRYVRLVVTATIDTAVEATLGAVATLTGNGVQPTGDEGLN